VDSNMHSRRQSIKGDHPAFEAPELILSEFGLLDKAPNGTTRAWDISELETIGGASK